jgi:hypothetical protein
MKANLGRLGSFTERAVTYKLYIDITNKPISNINESLAHLMSHL